MHVNMHIEAHSCNSTQCSDYDCLNYDFGSSAVKYIEQLYSWLFKNALEKKAHSFFRFFMNNFHIIC